MGVLRQALQGHPPGGVADQAFQLIAAMSGNISSAWGSNLDKLRLETLSGTIQVDPH